ncbi:alpha beta-hydrolase, partial [Mycena latifolia]
MARLTLSESVGMNLTLLQIPFLLVYISLFHRCSTRANGRPLTRVLGDATARFVLARLSVRQLQAVSGSTRAGYAKWVDATQRKTQRKMEAVVDELGEDASLMWVGARETGSVVLYCHGGGFVGPLSDFQVEFWYRVQQALLQNNGLKLGVAVLQCSTYPASFPTQLNQLLRAIQHLLSLGIPTSKICLAGDSAGANVVLQLLGHALHPSPLVAPAASPHLAGFAGMCLISPWTMPSDVSTADDAYDLVPAKTLALWAHTYLASIPDSHRVYMQPERAPPAWFRGAGAIARRVLITAGRNEVLYPSILRLSETLEEAYGLGDDGDVRLEVQEGGVHCDAMFDIAAKSRPTKTHPGERRVAEWLAET